MSFKLSRLKVALIILHALTESARSDTVEVTLHEGEVWRAKCGEGNDPEDLARIKWSKDDRIIQLNEDLAHISIVVNETIAKSVLEVDGVTSEDVGLYECMDPTLGMVADFYLYVLANESSLIAPIAEGEEFVSTTAHSPSVVPCRPAHPGVEVTLSNAISEQVLLVDNETMSYDPKIGFVLIKSTLTQHNGEFACRAAFEGREDELNFYLFFSSKPVETLAKPSIYTRSRTWMAGERAEIECTLEMDVEIIQLTNLLWLVPEAVQKALSDNSVMIVNSTIRGQYGKSAVAVSTLKVLEAREEFEGDFICEALKTREGSDEIVSSRSQLTIRVMSQQGVEWDTSTFNPEVKVREGHDKVRWVVGLDTYFKPRVVWSGPEGREIEGDDRKYSFSQTRMTESRHVITCTINNPTVDDMGVYALKVYDDATGDEAMGAIDMTLYVWAEPRISVPPTKFYLPESSTVLTATIKSFPSSRLRFDAVFHQCDNIIGCLNPRVEDIGLKFQASEVTPYTTEIRFDMSNYSHSGILDVGACNRQGCTNVSSAFLLHSGPDALYIEKAEVGDDVSLTCVASRLVFTSVAWYKEEQAGSDGEKTYHYLGLGQSEEAIIHDEVTSEYAIHHTLTVQNYSLVKELSGVYECRGKVLAKTILDDYPIPFETEVQKSVEGIPWKIPTFPRYTKYVNSSTAHYEYGANKTLICNVTGFPPPQLSWYKDGVRLSNSTLFRITQGGSNLTLLQVKPQLQNGRYSCVAQNAEGRAALFRIVEIEPKSKIAEIVVGVAATFALVVIVMFMFICYYNWRYKNAKKSLSPNEVRKLKEGDPEQLKLLRNSASSMRINDRASILPYDQRLEVSIERIKFGSLLGQGHFGQVFKARVDWPKTTKDTNSLDFRTGQAVVAVKALKNTADHSHVDALMSELKILAHIGRHENLVNLLGANTGGLRNKELYVLLEYCPYGDLRKVLLEGRRTFRQYDMSRSRSVKNDKNASENSAGNLTDEDSANLVGETISVNNNNELCISPSPMPLLQDTPNGQVPFDPTSRLDPEEKEGRFFYDPNRDYLTTGDLYIWALHIAKGMEFLAKKRVLHGDLACRNILISEKGVAKISDFGLSKDIYQSHAYQKQSSTPLPVKWMAPESLRDHIFTTQSDIWSYGILLWEMFSLGISPYPGTEVTDTFIQQLLDGFRMKCPAYAPQEIYDVMLQCWSTAPKQRIPFQRIVLILSRTYQRQEVSTESTSDYLLLSSPMSDGQSFDHSPAASRGGEYLQLSPQDGASANNIPTRQFDNDAYMGMTLASPESSAVVSRRVLETMIPPPSPHESPALFAQFSEAPVTDSDGYLVSVTSPGVQQHYRYSPEDQHFMQQQHLMQQQQMQHQQHYPEEQEEQQPFQQKQVHHHQHWDQNHQLQQQHKQQLPLPPVFDQQQSMISQRNDSGYVMPNSPSRNGNDIHFMI